MTKKGGGMTGKDVASSLIGYVLQPHINPDSVKNFGN
jgi:hypothetical protein